MSTSSDGFAYGPKGGGGRWKAALFWAAVALLSFTAGFVLVLLAR